MRLVLASSSAHRLALLRNAGVEIEAVASGLDERAAEAAIGPASPEDVAEILAEAKAATVSEAHFNALVIGADQTLALGQTRFDKPADMEAARRQLLALSGRTHRLSSAVVLAKGGETLWRHTATADITFRALTPAEVGRYLAEAGETALTSVGAYQVEGPGLKLMERIEGDFFTIVGLPMLPLLAELRRRGAFDG